ncbi:hypothetical protein ACFLTN_04730 [Chloroflexota bacterium]
MDNAGNWAPESSPVKRTVIASLFAEPSTKEPTATEPTILRSPPNTPQIKGELRSAKMIGAEVLGGFLGSGFGSSVATYSFEVENTGPYDWTNIRLAPLTDIDIIKAWYEQGFIKYVDPASVLFPTVYLSDSAQMRVGRIIEVPWIKLFGIQIGKRQEIEWVSEWATCGAVIGDNIVKAIILPQPVPAGSILGLIVEFEAPGAGSSHSACFALQTGENTFFPPPLDVSFSLTHIGK